MLMNKLNLANKNSKE